MAVETTNIAPEPRSGSKVSFAGAQPRVANPASSTSNAEVKKVAEEFASLLMLEMLKSMRATLSQEGLDGDKSSARDTYSSLADVEVTRALAKHDKMGLTSFLERALSRTAAKTETPTTASAPSVGEVSSRFGRRSDPLDGEE